MNIVSFCTLEYMYRDASNYKIFERALFFGTFEDRDERRLREHLLEGEWFIPEQVGLEPLQGRFAEYSATPNDDDHALHEFVALRPATRKECETLELFGEKQTILRAFETSQLQQTRVESLCEPRRIST